MLTLLTRTNRFLVMVQIEERLNSFMETLRQAQNSEDTSSVRDRSKGVVPPLRHCSSYPFNEE